MSLSRRHFLAVAGGAAGVLVAGCGSTPPKPKCATPATGPGLSYCLVENATVRIAGAARLAVGQVTLYNVDDQTAAIVARDAKGLYALSGICTHQCCVLTICDQTCGAVLTNPGDCAATPIGGLIVTDTAFVCACHGSGFAADGTVLSGPATQSLPAVAMRIEGDDVIVDLSQPADRSART